MPDVPTGYGRLSDLIAFLEILMFKSLPNYHKLYTFLIYILPVLFHPSVDPELPLANHFNKNDDSHYLSLSCSASTNWEDHNLVQYRQWYR